MPPVHNLIWFHLAHLLSLGRHFHTHSFPHSLIFFPLYIPPSHKQKIPRYPMYQSCKRSHRNFNSCPAAVPLPLRDQGEILNIMLSFSFQALEWDNAMFSWNLQGPLGTALIWWNLCLVRIRCVIDGSLQKGSVSLIMGNVAWDIASWRLSVRTKEVGDGDTLQGWVIPNKGQWHSSKVISGGWEAPVLGYWWWIGWQTAVE